MTRAVRADREPVSGLPPEQALDDLRVGLSRNLNAGGSAPDLAAQMEVERDRVRALRRAIADRIEADLAILDALHGHTAPGEGDGIAVALGESESLRLLLAAPCASREGGA